MQPRKGINMLWSEQYATGIGRIDEQHKTLFEMAETFRTALDKKVGKRVYESLLESLDGYAAAHFNFEEECMERYRCPVAETNMQEHRNFVEVLAGFKQRYAANGFDPLDARKLVETVNQWLASHICRVDINLKQYAPKP
jgi:hemerythrin